MKSSSSFLLIAFLIVLLINTISTNSSQKEGKSNKSDNDDDLKEKDNYKILGIPRNATPAQIRKAFKKLSLKYHPDKNKDRPDWAKKRFIHIAAAYEVLSNKERREYYDKYGRDKDAQGSGFDFGETFGKNFGKFDDYLKFFESYMDFDLNSFFGGGKGGKKGGNGKGKGKKGSKGNKNKEKTGFKLFDDILEQFGGNIYTDEPDNEDELNANIAFFSNSTITHIKLNNLSLINKKTDNAWFIVFYRPRDYYSIESAWRQLSEKSNGIFYLGAVNCYFDPEICEDFGISSTPLALHIPDIHTRDRYQQKIYDGNFNWADIFTFGAERMANFVHETKDDNYEAIIEGYSTVSLLFTARKVTAPIYKLMSTQFKDSIVFCEVHSSNKKLVEMHKVTTFPELLLLHNGQWTKFTSTFNKEELNKFYSKIVDSTPAGSTDTTHNSHDTTLANDLKTNSEGFKIKQIKRFLFNKFCNHPDEKFICGIFISRRPELNKNEIDMIQTLTLKYERKLPIKIFLVKTDDHPLFLESIEHEDRFDSIIVVYRYQNELRYIGTKSSNYKSIISEFGTIVNSKDKNDNGSKVLLSNFVFGRPEYTEL